jgi:hypothetical protein
MPIERLAADVVEHQRRPVAQCDDLERADHAIGSDRGQQRRLVAKPRE